MTTTSTSVKNVKHVMLCGTHPSQYNGYSKVVYELSKEFGKFEDVKLYIFGFQNFYDKQDHKLERTLPSNIEIYDVYKNEEPKSKGFGENLIIDYVKKIDPDIIIIYNDLVVITSLLKKLKEIKEPRFKLVPYIDLVYKNEKNSLINNINDLVDGGIMFTDYWKDVITYQGFTKKTHVLQHGFNKNMFYPIPKKISRKFFNISVDDFVIVNLNRNQPRKRWDICIMAFVKLLSLNNNIDKPIKLMIATGVNGGWDLVDMMTSECKKNGLDFNEVKKHLIILQNPQQLTDREINLMYNVGDIGLNTCDGEGFGLCNFEQAGIGVPQIVPNIGGFKDFLCKKSSILITPKWSYYCDHSRDFVAGEAEVCDVDDFVQALEFYYNNKKIRDTHGKQSRERIFNNYSWDIIAKKLYDIVSDYAHDIPPRNNNNSQLQIEGTQIGISKKIDINELIKQKLECININDINTDTDEDIEIIEGGG